MVEFTMWLLAACIGASDPEGPEEIETPAQRAAAIARLDREDVNRQRELLQAQLLGDRSPAVRAAAAAALGFTAHSRESIPTLAAALARETDEEVQRRLVAVLVDFADDQALEAVIRFWLDHPGSPVRETASSALAGADPRKVCAALHRVRATDGESVAPLLRQIRCPDDP